MSILLLGPFKQQPHQRKPKPKSTRLLQFPYGLAVFAIGILIGGLATYQWHNALAATDHTSNTVDNTTLLNQSLSEIINLSNQTYQKPYTQPAQTKLEIASKLALQGRYQEANTQLTIAKQIINKPLNDTNRQATIPIVMYHKMPSDITEQLQYLKQAGYTTITMQQVGDYLRGYTDLPNKPVVLTFDDGYSDGLQIAQLLEKENLRGTFYLIVGGDASRHCIGPERTDHSCGDSFLNWAEIETMAKMPAVEVGVHTVDHADLPTLNPVDQMWQIVTAKNILEQRTGLKLTTFAYPYGHFNSTTVELVKSAGFETAVTTMSGSTQATSDLFTLRRIRTTHDLP